ncbi:MAG TPA: C39 family peptidase [Patescibacteria group bacterium]
MKLQKILFFLASLLLLINTVLAPVSVKAQTVTPTDTPTPTSAAPDNSSQISDLQSKINDLLSKISDLKGQEKTLSSQIALMDSQIKVTEYRIESTQEQILSLEEDIDTAQNKITNLEGSLNNLTKIMANRIVTGYEVGSENPFQLLIASSSIGDFFKRSSYLTIVERHDKQLVYDTVQAKNDYANQKQIYEDEKQKVVALQQQLQNYTNDLNNQKKEKQELLTETQGNEGIYQQQLAAYQAQLSALSNFATSRAGVGGSIIPHEDLSDGWGKYYNQRDANWGNNIIGYSSEQIWQVGCLLTSFAMVSTHYGSTVTPADVAANTDNFALGTAFFRLPGPAPAGHSVSYVQNPSLDSLRSALNSGSIVIAGLSANGGPSPQHYSDHWIVLRSVDGNSFRINDPWYSDGMNALLSDHYSGWTIIEARIYN